MRARIRELPPGAAAALRRAALLGPEFTVLDWQAVTGLSAAELMDAVDAGIAAGLLTDAEPKLAFHPPLAWQLFYAQLPEAERAASRQPPVPPDNKPPAGWPALTPAERRVAHLVAEGYSNPEIAARLFLSRNTVQTHVSRILAKLGVRSRVEVAIHAAEASN